MASRRAFALLILLSPALAAAGEGSFYFLNNLAVQYEGTGFRQVPSGWELKVKPQGTGEGFRWRGGRWQAQYWRNNPYFSFENGNSATPTLQQRGQTRLSFDTLVLDGRLPLAGCAVEAVAGLQGTRVLFEREKIQFQLVPEAASARERLTALGPTLGLHGAAENPFGKWALWADGEILATHYFWTRNRLRAEGGGLHRDGYGYLFRAEAGLRRGAFRIGVGVVRQATEIVVPGGLALPGGAAASLPVNHVDFESPFVSLTWTGL
jgi:hypothetical protein